MKNYSKQREAVLNALRSTDTHPTANWIYNKVRESLPNISLGTVYRNLSALNDAGEILCINVGDGMEHFDGNNSPHLHLHCTNCKTIYDAFSESDPFEKIALSKGFTPQNSIYVVYGVCKNCKLNSINGGN